MILGTPAPAEPSPSRDSGRQPSNPVPAPDRFERPERTAIAQLEPFAGLGLKDITLVTDARTAEAALEELKEVPVLGFDTESRPVFVKGRTSDGPHLVQFATPDEAWLFPLHLKECRAAVAALLNSSSVTKVGSGLAYDIKTISAKLRIKPQAILDLDHEFRKFGCRDAIGLKTAIALVFNRRFVKSKKVTTSNWANRELTDRQLLYAANDAYAAIRVYQKIKEGWKPKRSRAAAAPRGKQQAP